jgi:hypothetical protein
MLRRVVERLQELEDTAAHPLASVRLVVSEKDVLVARDRDTLMSLIEKPGQYVWRIVVELAPLVNEVRAALAEKPVKERKSATTKKKIATPARSRTRRAAKAS